MYKNYLKRLLDVFFSFILIIVLAPLLVIVAVLTRLLLGTPILFKQKRPGLNEKVFTIYKFRSMNEKKDKEGNLLPDFERLTKFGIFLRNSSLDELPELINILKGDMSFVGPRPLLVDYLRYYNDIQKRRHLVRPGLTGLAQVNGRNATTWDERFKHDINYVDSVSFFLDVKILLKTLKITTFREGINLSNNETMNYFRGSENNSQS